MLDTKVDDLTLNVQVVLEDEPLMTKDEEDKDEENKDKETTSAKAEEAAMASTPATKVLFLDGIRGLAAILVVTRHAREYMNDVDMGAIGVDTFFVLSSFLLTWLFMKKSIQMVNQGAGVRTWMFTVADYFSRRFFRVYPLFAITCLILWFIGDKARWYYFLVRSPSYDLYKTLTFEFEYRYFVFWTLPLEISYYFFIPILVWGTLLLRKLWWVPYIPAYCWVINEGIHTYRSHHMGLRPHFPTFLAGSMAAVVFVKMDMWIKSSGFQFRFFHKLILRTIELSALAVFLSLAFRGLFFIWVHDNPVPKAKGYPFVSVYLTIVLVCEMLLPSSLSSMFEWNVLRYCGKISFSVYLLHGFVLFNEHVKTQRNYYCRLFSRFGLVCMLATASYHLIEYPFHLLAQRITKALKEQEIKGSGGLTMLLGMGKPVESAN